MSAKHPDKQEYRLTLEYDEHGVPLVHVFAPGYVLKGNYLIWPHVQEELCALASALDGRDEYGSVIVFEEAAPDASIGVRGMVPDA